MTTPHLCYMNIVEIPEIRGFNIKWNWSKDNDKIGKDSWTALASYKMTVPYSILVVNNADDVKWYYNQIKH